MIIEAKKPFSSVLLILSHLFLGIGATFGGVAFILDPSGKLIHMPLSALDSSPFHNFLIPGMILLIVFGAIPFMVAFSLLTGWEWKPANYLNLFSNMHWYWTYSLYIGFALIIWITVQVSLMKAVAAIHIVYIILGLVIQAITLLPSIQNYYGREN